MAVQIDGKMQKFAQGRVGELVSWHTTRAVANDRVGGWGYKCEHRGFTMGPIDAPKYEGIGPRMAEKRGN